MNFYGTAVGAGKMEVEHRLAVRFIAGVNQLLRLGFVAGAQTFLLAGGGVLGIINAVAAEQGVFRFHVHGVEACNRTVATR